MVVRDAFFSFSSIGWKVFVEKGLDWETQYVVVVCRTYFFLRSQFNELVSGLLRKGSVSK